MDQSNQLSANQFASALTSPPAFDPAKIAHTLTVGLRALEHFKTGLATGAWEPFFAMLADDFTLYFPHGKFRGLSTGKAKGEEFFRYVTETFGGCLLITEVLRIAASETTFIFEFRNEGQLRGAAYKNRVTISWDIRGEQIIAAREYFGSDGQAN